MINSKVMLQLPRVKVNETRLSLSEILAAYTEASYAPSSSGIICCAR